MKKRQRIDTLIDAHVALRRKEAKARVPEPKKVTKPAGKASFIESMECLPVTKLPEGSQWSWEIKLSGLGAGVWTSPLSQEKASLEA
jgi:hypothetical protein